MAHQKELEKTLLRLVSPSSAASAEGEGTSSPSPSPSPSSSKGRTPAAQMPKPGRPARQLIARCLILLLQRAESRSLFETSHSLLRIAAEEPTKSKPNVAEKEAKVAALYILGEIFAVQGQNVMSLFLEITSLTQKLFRSNTYPVILRYHALTCLQKALLVGAKSLNDQPAKEIVKNLRSGLTDKAGAIVRGCTEVRRARERPPCKGRTADIANVSTFSRSASCLWPTRPTTSPVGARSKPSSHQHSRLSRPPTT